MNKDFRILLEDELLPVQAFFNAVPQDSFLKTLEAFSRGVGASFNDCHCELPGDLDPEEEPIVGVRFALYEQEVVISFNDFILYLSKVCSAFIKQWPDSESGVNAALEAVRLPIEKIQE